MGTKIGTENHQNRHFKSEKWINRQKKFLKKNQKILKSHFLWGVLFKRSNNYLSRLQVVQLTIYN